MRYIRMMIKILIPIWIISWLILMPINAVGTSVDGKNGLDRFTFGHVSCCCSPYHRWRL
jgi:calcium permeable stress-gated cation channel